MEIRRYAAILWRRRWLIGLAMVCAVALTALTADRTAVYTSKATIYVGATSFGGADGAEDNLSGDQAVGLNQVIRTFSLMIASASIAEDAIELTGVQRSPLSVVQATTATPIPGTNILQVEVSDADPAVAQALATGMAQAFVTKLSELEPGQPLGEGDVPRAPAQLFERALLATSPSSESPVSRLFVAALLAFAASAGLVLLADYLDLTLKSPDDAEVRLQLPVLGVVPELAIDPASTARALRARGDDDLELLGNA